MFLADMQATKDIKECHLPSSWAGVWFQQGVRPYSTIDRTTISNKGTCVSKHRDKVVVKKDSCYKCIVFHRRHVNVLQYKESVSCLPASPLASLCSSIPGDAPLYTLFRVHTQPIRCPLQGPLQFSYNFGRGSCSSPLSTLQSCTLESRISLQYQACPNVLGSEMKNTQFECLASWREGRYSYLVGRMEDAHTSLDEDRYRCVMWERVVEEGEHRTFLSISGDASCNGLFSTREGRALVLYPGNPSPSCGFPSWLLEGKTWTSLGGELILELEDGGSLQLTRRTLVKDGGRYYHQSETSQVRCSSVREDEDDTVLLVTHVTTGCTTGFVCTLMKRRAESVVDILIGRLSATPEYACDQDYYTPSLPPTTLVGVQTSACPLQGRYDVSMKHSDFSMAVKPDILSTGGGGRGSRCSSPYLLVLGCSDRDMVFTACHGGLRETSGHQCHTHWREGETHFLITKTTNREQQYSCYSYREGQEGGLEVEMRGQHCFWPSSPPSSSPSPSTSTSSSPFPPTVGEHSFRFNMSLSGECGEVGGGRVEEVSLVMLLLCLLAR